MRMIGAQTMVLTSSEGNSKPNDGSSSPSNAIHGVVLKSTVPRRQSKLQKKTIIKKDDPLAFVGARPSDIKYASKRAQERKEALRRREEEAQLKMQKFRDEINAIKQMEVEEESNEEEKDDQEDHEEEEEGEAEPLSKRDLSSDRLDELQSEAKELEMEQDMEKVLGMLADEYEYDEDEDMPFDCCRTTKDIGSRVIHEMNASFAQISLNVGAADAQDVDTTAASREPVRRRELQATKSGRLEKVNTNPKQPSNLVPEMRRRATQRDLTFDDHQVVVSKDLGSLSTHSPVTGLDVCSPKANKESVTINKSDIGKLSAHSENAAEEETEPVTTDHPPLGKKEKAMKAADAAKLEEEKRQMEEQRKKIEEAKEAFQVGHDLCWKSEKPKSALQEYRKALFIRESLLGKYHEETGRSYFWIGKSLVKLREFDEALVAYSRAMRIFDRVLMQSHKYNRWATMAIESVFRELDADEDRDYDSYKKGIDSSIKHEKAGDGCRKRGQYDQAIAEYRAAIDNIQEYHPDAADLYCKIAILMRQRGEFDRALEEYKFASEIYELSLGAEHPETVKTLNQLYEKKRSSQVAMALMDKLKMRV